MMRWGLSGEDGEVLEDDDVGDKDDDDPNSDKDDCLPNNYLLLFCHPMLRHIYFIILKAIILMLLI